MSDYFFIQDIVNFPKKIFTKTPFQQMENLFNNENQ